MIYSVAQIVNYYRDHERVYGKTIESSNLFDLSESLPLIQYMVPFIRVEPYIE